MVSLLTEEKDKNWFTFVRMVSKRKNNYSHTDDGLKADIVSSCTAGADELKNLSPASKEQYLKITGLFLFS